MLFDDMDNPREVRIASWDVIAETIRTIYPVSWSDLIKIIEGLKEERDVHVGSYLLSWLWSWADHAELDEQRCEYVTSIFMVNLLNVDILFSRARFAQFALYSSGAVYWGKRFPRNYLNSRYNIISWSPFETGK